jgi:hypothetical protein
MVSLSTAGPERKFQRASCRVPARFRVPGQAARRAELLTIGIGGAFLATPRPPTVGAAVHLDFTLDAHHFRLPAWVAWNSRENLSYRRWPHRRAGFAAEFENLSLLDREVLDRYVRHRNRAFRLLAFELNRPDPDPALIKAIFRQLCPGQSSHARHIRKIVQHELRHFRLRK